MSLQKQGMKISRFEEKDLGEVAKGEGVKVEGEKTFDSRRAEGGGSFVLS